MEMLCELIIHIYGIALWYIYGITLLLQKSGWKIKLGELKSDQKYFAK